MKKSILGIVGVGILAAGIAKGEEISFVPGTRIEMPGLTDLEGPTAVDFDFDGKVDLLSGLYRGHLLFRKNTGTGDKPVFQKPVRVQSGGKDIKLKHW